MHNLKSIKDKKKIKKKEKINCLKEQIKNNTYNVTTNDLIEKLLKK